MNLMRQSTAVEALVRWLVLAAAGLALLLVLPSDAFGSDALVWVAGRPATAANMVGLGLMFVAWILFLVRLFTLRGNCRRDGVCRVLAGVFGVTAIAALVASAVGSVGLVVGFTIPALAAQIGMAVRADRVNARVLLGPRRRLAASRS